MLDVRKEVSSPQHFPNVEMTAYLARAALDRCGVDGAALGGSGYCSTPITGAELTSLRMATASDVEQSVRRARACFERWRSTPAPARAVLVKRFAQLLEAHTDDLATLITLEVGKTPREARGEVREIIEMCDMAVGMSHQLYGRTMPSGRASARLMETYQPLGPVAIISPFSFPAASWGWSAPVALVCGNPVVWKPSERAPLTAMACASLLARAAAETGSPADVCQVIVGGPDVGEWLAGTDGIELVSLSGTAATGRRVAGLVAGRLRRLSLSLGGNNACVVAPTADLDLAIDGIVTAATSAAGQRCTTMRRLLVHHSVADDVVGRLADRFGDLIVGNPLADGTAVGPLVDAGVYGRMAEALEEASRDGGRVLFGGARRYADELPDAYYVEPVILRMPEQSPVVRRETLAPLLYVLEYGTIDDAVLLNNAVPQGFTSSIYTNDQREAERFLAGSDCGIVNVNLHTSGAEVGTAFGGEKETGGGRLCGSDAWMVNMRRVTSAVLQG